MAEINVGRHKWLGIEGTWKEWFLFPTFVIDFKTHDSVSFHWLCFEIYYCWCG